MKSQLRAAGSIFVVLTLLTGVVYPVVVWAIGQLAFPYQANGSVLLDDGKPIGSELIGQSFQGPRYFCSRPAATDPPYNSASSTGSNLGPTSPDLIKTVNERVDALRIAHPGHTGPIPIDLVTASASGLDPHISPAAAEYQVARVAKARDLDESKVCELVAQFTEGRTMQVLGEPRVNVLKLNLALVRLNGK